MTADAERHEFNASEVAELLAELDLRLRRRGVSAGMRYYTDRATLEFIVDGDDVDRELRFLAGDAAGLLAGRGRVDR